MHLDFLTLIFDLIQLVLDLIRRVVLGGLRVKGLKAVEHDRHIPPSPRLA